MIPRCGGAATTYTVTAPRTRGANMSRPAIILWSLVIGFCDSVAAQTPHTNTSRSLADPAWADTVTSDTIPIVFTASGGISLGVYQAGVTWALVNFMRAANADRAYRVRHKLPAFRLEATTGASTGNVNALI